ncbi:MAG TPA: hypothetical protein VJ742_06965 [Nitrososphaera sp.]|nr:hypothetical protein [Nitrososphaera sp.]
MKNERHSYIGKGISREAFQDIAVQHTVEDDTLHWYLHAHSYNESACNERCQVVHRGIVATGVTQMDVANGPSGT